MLRRYIFTSISFLWLGLIALLSLFDQETNGFSNTGGGYSEDITMPPFLIKIVSVVGFDSIFHSLAYSLAGVLFMLFLWERFRNKIPIGRAMILTMGVLFIYGIILEILQVNFTDRSGEVSDAVSNTLGALFGVLAIAYIFRRMSVLNWHN